MWTESSHLLVTGTGLDMKIAPEANFAAHIILASRSSIQDIEMRNRALLRYRQAFPWRTKVKSVKDRQESCYNSTRI